MGIQQMGSSISVQSPWTGPNGEQSGAKFSFNLHLKVASPLPKVASQAARTLPVEVDLLPEPQLPRQLRVLIADDVKMNRKLLRAALSRHCCSEWEIDEAATAEAAVAEMSSTIDSRYDLVLMDDHFEVDGSGAKPSKMGAWEHDPSLVAMRGSEAIAYIRAFELQNPSLRPRSSSCARAPRLMLTPLGENMQTRCGESRSPISRTTPCSARLASCSASDLTSVRYHNQHEYRIL